MYVDIVGRRGIATCDRVDNNILLHGCRSESCFALLGAHQHGAAE